MEYVSASDIISSSGNTYNIKKDDILQERNLFISVIADAISTYLIFPIVCDTDNNLEEFWYSYNYLYNVRSNDKTSWNEDRVSSDISMNDIGKKETYTKTLDDAQMALMCFDKHFYVVKFDTSIEVFLKQLLNKRVKSLLDNWDYVYNFLLISNPSANKYDKKTIMKILSEPESYEQLQALFTHGVSC